MKYTVITKNKAYESDPDAIFTEQAKKIIELGLDDGSLWPEVKVHFFNSAFFNEEVTVMNIYEAIRCIAVKDGMDMVLFENGNYGFIAYYNGDINGFEIVNKPNNDSHA